MNRADPELPERSQDWEHHTVEVTVVLIAITVWAWSVVWTSGLAWLLITLGHVLLHSRKVGASTSTVR